MTLFRVKSFHHVNGMIRVYADSLTGKWQPKKGALAAWIGVHETMYTKVHIQARKMDYVLIIPYTEDVWNTLYVPMVVAYSIEH